MLAVLSFNLIGDALRDYLDPRSRNRSGSLTISYAIATRIWNYRVILKVFTPLSYLLQEKT